MGQLELSNLTASLGFTLNGVTTGDASGTAVSGIGDLNDDGVADIVIGAYEASPEVRFRQAPAM